ncbi:hypothetical protein AND_004763 [Anopheles darlingi]|uniref:Transcription factor Adf-1 n=1 Tax=Anopheles darlingi TaxID=43151 RepID=W5JJP9_ANODA|nr:hypothetical protein AND_004763 [Anopheles darlingi]
MLNGIGFLKGSKPGGLIVYEAEPTESLFNPMDGGAGGGGEGGGLSVDFYNKRQFVKVNEAVFVEEVKKRPILYDTGMRQSKRIKPRTEAWREVSQAVNLSVQECRKRWRSMRDAFMKQVRTKSEEERKCWVHYRLLEFLLPYIAQRQMANMISSEEYEHDYDFVELDSDNELYDGEPMTVSYVTEDGDEVFKVLHTPSMPPLPDTALINVEDTDFTDGGEETCLNEAMLGTALIPQEVIIQENQLTSLINQQSLRTDQYGHCAPVSGHSLIVMSEEEVESIEGDVRDEEEDEEIEEMEDSHSQKEPQQPQQTESRKGEDGEVTSFLYEEHLDSALLASEQSTTNPKDQCVALLSEETLVYNGDGHETELEPDQYQSPPTTTKRCISAGMEEQSHAKRQCDRNTLPGFRIEEEEAALTVSSHVAPVTPRPSEPTKESDARLGITDSDERFLLSCAPILQQLPAKKNHLARLKIQQLLYELQYDEKYNCEVSN